MTAIKRFAILLLVLLLCGCSNQTNREAGILDRLPEITPVQESPTTDHDIPSTSDPDNREIPEAITASLLPPTGAYFPEDELKAVLTIDNPTDQKLEIWTELKLINRNGEEVYSSLQSSHVLGRCYLEEELSFPKPELTRSGTYETKMTAWNGQAGTNGAYVLAEKSSERGFVLYQRQEDFDRLDEDIWVISEKRLGRSGFRPDNVSVSDGILTIHMPAGTFEGGEISSKEQFGYGAYEARMKLPDVPSSITGFFLYEAPDYYYEIDIELYNTPESQLMLTTYAEGEVKQQYTTDLDFDPTKEFHDYRIEYQEDGLEFYVDNELIIGWPDGFPDGKMRLMINTWYPKWLKGIKAEGDQSLMVDWLRF